MTRVRPIQLHNDADQLPGRMIPPARWRTSPGERSHGDAMNKPSVLILHNRLPPYRLPLFQRLTESQAMDVVVAYGKVPPGDSLPNVREPAGIRSVLLRNYFTSRKRILFYQGGALGLVRSRKYDIIIASFDIHILSNIVACLWARIAGIGFVWWGHGIGPRGHPVSREIRLLLAKMADALIFYDESRARQFVAWGLDPAKAFVAWNSIDTDLIDNLAAKWSASQRNRILFIGRLIPEKKVDLLIRGFASGRSHLRERVTLTIIGDGPERSALEALAGQLGLAGEVEFVGELFDQHRLAKFFNSSLLCVSPGYVGLNAIQSLAYGVPMLIADIEPHSPEISAIEEGVNAQFFPAGDAEALGLAIADVCNGGKLERMSRAARRTVRERFNLGAMVKSFEEVVAFLRPGMN
jgi:glycosyltransferase involved in cell wall biosynthesis